MVAYNFQARFVDALLSGRKRQTIRAERRHPSRHARPGETLQLYTAVRTCQCRLIGKAVCERVEAVELVFSTEQCWVKLSEHSVLEGNAVLRFAQADGFADLVGWRAWWLADITPSHRECLAEGGTLWWTGVLVTWRDFTPRADYAG